MTVETKITANFEVSDPRDLAYDKKQLGRARLFDSVRLGLSSVAFLAGITILGTSANALMVYDQTHVSRDFNLPLWPDALNTQPTVALVAAGVIVVVVNLVSLVFSRVNSLRAPSPAHTILAFTVPFIGFAVSLIAVCLFYAVDASSTVDTIQSWSCRWGEYADMRVQPYFGTLCSQSRTALYLAVGLVPAELVIFGMAALQMSAERKTARVGLGGRSGSL
ncbi:hypothetical protein GGR50DRAFT_283132 [Xylaria sp. CBS 124048]|nr:hypothetical protein GGR50DRAFT_283132 [Xylaria sp. CBS 124048]